MNPLSFILSCKRSIKQFALFVLLCAVSYFCLSAWWGSRVAGLPDHDFLPDIQQLRAAGRIGEAAAMARTVSALEGMPNGGEIQKISEELEAEYGSWSRRTKDFLKGALTGNTDASGEALAGAILTDFLFIGDIRDLAVQAHNKMTDEDVDEFIVVLSTAGLAATIASWVPEPTSTAAGVTARPVLSMLKGLKRVGALTRTMADEIVSVFKRAAKAGEMTGPAKAVCSDVGTLMLKTPAGTLPAVVKHAESAEDLSVAAKWISAIPDQTVTALSVGGKQALDWMNQLGEVSDKQLGMILRKGAQGFAKTRLPIRGAKFVYRGRLTELAVFSPSFRLFMLVLGSASGLWAIWIAGSMVARLGTSLAASTSPARS